MRKIPEVIKLADSEIEKQISQNMLLAGQSLGNNYLYLYRANQLAKQHSQYEQKYKLTFQVIKHLPSIPKLW